MSEEKSSLQPIGKSAFMWLWQKVVINWQREETSSVPNVAIIRYGTHGTTSPSQKGQIFQRYTQSQCQIIIQYWGRHGSMNMNIIWQIYFLHKVSNNSAEKGPPLFIHGLSFTFSFGIISWRRKDVSCIKCIRTKSTWSKSLRRRIFDKPRHSARTKVIFQSFPFSVFQKPLSPSTTQ